MVNYHSAHVISIENSSMYNVYIVESKGDDYNACLTELVETTPENAKEYYSSKLVSTEDVIVLKKYFELIPFSEENERDSDRRFCGMNY